MDRAAAALLLYSILPALPAATSARQIAMPDVLPISIYGVGLLAIRALDDIVFHLPYDDQQCHVSERRL